MIGALHDDARERGEPAAILTASESVDLRPLRLRRRDLARRALDRAARTRSSRVRSTDPGRVRIIESRRGREDAPVRVRRDPPHARGMVSRPDFWWPQVFLGSRARADKAYFVAVHEDASGAADGFVEYELNGEWQGGHSDRRVIVCDMQAADPQRAHRALAVPVRRRPRRGRDRDQRADRRSAPPCSRRRPAGARRLRQRRTVARAARPAHACSRRARYAPFDGHVVLEVHAPDGSTRRFAVDGNDRDAHCAETDAAPDLTMSVAVLGATILGGNRFDGLRGRPNWCRRTNQESWRTRTRCSSRHRRPFS